jgi:hypothetical protein
MTARTTSPEPACLPPYDRRASSKGDRCPRFRVSTQDEASTRHGLDMKGAQEGTITETD